MMPMSKQKVFAQFEMYAVIVDVVLYISLIWFCICPLSPPPPGKTMQLNIKCFLLENCCLIFLPLDNGIVGCKIATSKFTSTEEFLTSAGEMYHILTNQEVFPLVIW